MSGFRAGTVALVGRPNVGKSTLLNTLVGAKLAIVSDKPQTTRNCIRGVLDLEAAQLVLVDTPGIHRPLHRLNERMLQAALAALKGVDVVAVLSDASAAWGAGDRYLAGLVREVAAPLFLVLNKIDLLPRPRLLPVIERWSKACAFAEVYPVSALGGEGTEALLAGLTSRLPVGPPLFGEDDWTDVSERFLAAEIVREKVLLLTRQELPYSTTVLLDGFELPEPGSRGALRIEASVVVERPSQKAILIGRGGDRIKRIGTLARQELEKLLERRLYLGLRVKVQPGWRDDRSFLDRLGLREPPGPW